MNSSIFHSINETFTFKDWTREKPFHEENETFWNLVEDVDPSSWLLNFKERQFWALYIATIYIFTVFSIEWAMKKLPPMDLSGSLFLWNFSLGIFSIAGFLRTLPKFVEILQTEDGFYKSVCSQDEWDPTTHAWILWFMLSKVVELGDTVFIVLRKRPLIFLQWYHHVVSMSSAWLLCPLAEPVLRWFGLMNFGVHSLMYPYFAVRALGWRVPLPLVNLITTVQFTQMIAGIFVNMMSLYFLKSGYNCNRETFSIQIFCWVYGTFIILFGQLFYKSVILKGHSKKGTEQNRKKID